MMSRYLLIRYSGNGTVPVDAASAGECDINRSTN